MAHFCVSTIAEAIVNDNITELRRLLAKRRRPESQDNLGYTWLHLAVKRNSAAIVSILLKIPGISVNTPNFEGFTPLLLACDNPSPNLSIIKSLVKHKADVNRCTNEHISSLHFACKFKSLPLVKLLHKYGAYLNTSDFNYYTPLHYALEQRSHEIVTYLLENDANVNQAESHGLNSFMYAIIFALEFAIEIFPHVSNVNAVAKDGRSALALACYKQHIPLVQLLLNAGAYVDPEMVVTSALLYTFRSLNFRLFQLVWKFVKFDEPSCSLEFVYEAIGCWGFNDIKYYKVMLMTPGFTLESKPNILKHLFQREPKNLHEVKSNIYRIVSMFLDANIVVENVDILYFIIFFQHCNWAYDLLDLIMCRTYPQFSRKLISICLERRMISEALVLLKYCYRIDSYCLYKQIYAYPVLTHIQFYIKYFTPPNPYRLCLIRNLEDINNANEIINVLHFDNIPSLKELSRDAFRINLLKTTGYSSEFFQEIESLEVPTVIKDILRFRDILYPHSFKHD